MSIWLILLSILKYIGIILGIVLGILLLGVLIILFVPVRYSIHILGSKDTDVDLKITWFINLMYYHYVVKESKMTKKLFRLFGKTLIKKDTIKDVVKVDEESDAKTKDKSKENCEKKEGIKKETRRIQHKKIAKPIKKINESAKAFKEDTIEEAKEQVEEKDSFGIKELMDYPHKKEVVSHTYELIKNLILHIMPRDFYLHAEFGFKDPSHTGYTLGLIGIIKPYFGNSVHIKGNFDKEIFIGEIKGKGKFSIGVIIGHIIVYLLKKPIKNIIKLYLRKRKEDNNGIELEE
ncbi:MAG: DUF2953 domain-containing protein [Epulopiscium sp.]|nr:DUF2953 domain-containing protein [Candidatus Epulonipiscium sp.]